MAFAILAAVLLIVGITVFVYSCEMVQDLLNEWTSGNSNR